MRNNPYNEALKIIREEGAVYNPPMIQKGIVKSTSPLQIIIGELPLFENNLDIPKNLLGYTENVAITQNGQTQSATITHESIIKENDTAILYPVENGQKYILLGVV